MTSSGLPTDLWPWGSKINDVLITVLLCDLDLRIPLFTWYPQTNSGPHRNFAVSKQEGDDSEKFCHPH